eukprot:4765165-Amphidinium_carterae.2
MLSMSTGSMVLDWQVQLASAPPHASGLGVPHIPTTACIARYALYGSCSIQTTVALHFAELEAPTILSFFAKQHHRFALARCIPGIRQLLDVWARKHIQRRITFFFTSLQADVQERFVEGVSVG